MYLLQTDPSQTLLFGFLGLIISFMLLYVVIKLALNDSRLKGYQEAQLKLTAMMAKRKGVNSSYIKEILEMTDSSLLNNDEELKADLEL